VLSSQLSLPVEVNLDEVARKKTLGAAITLCADLANKCPKVIAAELKLDKAQWSRWESGTEGIIWPKFEAVMDKCGNDVPLLWMNHARGYDLHSLRRKQTETEAENSRLRDEIAALRRAFMRPV
jgi:hypothetical protein